MDFALITNLLLFLGAMGVTFALDSGGNRSDDDDGDRAEGDMESRPALHLIGMDEAQTGEDSLAADRDNLAWFLNSGEVSPEALPSHSFAALPAPEPEPQPDPEPVTPPDMDPFSQDRTAPDEDNTTEPDWPGLDGGAPDTTEDPAPALETSIELAYLPAIDPETGLPLPPELDVTPTEDGGGSVIWLDGLEVARFDDLADLTADQITLVPEDEAPEADAPETGTEDQGDDPEDPVVIDGFSPGADQIEIAYHPATDADGHPLPPEVSIEHDPEAEDEAALVLLDGHVVARVLGSGAAQLRPADIVTTAI